MALIVDIEKTLGDFHLKVNFTAEREVMALLGASGGDYTGGGEDSGASSGGDDGGTYDPEA